MMPVDCFRRHRSSISLQRLEQGIDIVTGESGGNLAVSVVEAGSEILLAALKLADAFFDSAGGDQVIDHDLFILTDAAGAVGGLFFDGGIPPRIVVDDGIGGGQSQAAPTGFEALIVCGIPFVVRSMA